MVSSSAARSELDRLADDTLIDVLSFLSARDVAAAGLGSRRLFYGSEQARVPAHRLLHRHVVCSDPGQSEL